MERAPCYLPHPWKVVVTVWPEKLRRSKYVAWESPQIVYHHGAELISSLPAVEWETVSRPKALDSFFPKSVYGT